MPYTLPPLMSYSLALSSTMMSCTVHSPTDSLTQPTCILVYIECNPAPGGSPFELSLGLRSNSRVLLPPSLLRVSCVVVCPWFFALGHLNVKDVHGALTNLDTKMDDKVGHIKNMLQGLTEAITDACPSPILIPLSGGHPPAYPVLSGTPLWSFFCVAADC